MLLIVIVELCICFHFFFKFSPNFSFNQPKTRNLLSTVICQLNLSAHAQKEHRQNYNSQQPLTRFSHAHNTNGERTNNSDLKIHSLDNINMILLFKDVELNVTVVMVLHNIRFKISHSHSRENIKENERTFS